MPGTSPRDLSLHSGITSLGPPHERDRLTAYGPRVVRILTQLEARGAHKSTNAGVRNRTHCGLGGAGANKSKAHTARTRTRPHPEPDRGENRQDR